MILRRVATRTLAWAFALVAALALAAAPSATAQPGAAADAVTPRAFAGVYQISFGGSDYQLLTEEPGSGPGAHVVLLPPGDGNQRWVVQPYGSGYTIRSQNSGLFLAIGELRNRALAVVSAEPYRWDIDSASRFDRVFISASGPEGHSRLDVSPLLIYPPRVDVVQFPRPDQEWQLTRIG